MSGLFAALLLRRKGFDVEIFERSTADLEGRGAGIVTHPELFTILQRAGIDVAPTDLGVHVEGRRILDAQGDIIAETAYPQVLTSWGRLYAELKAALPKFTLNSGAALDYVDVQDDHVTAHFADGRSATGDLLIGADGLFSAVRKQFLPDIVPLYSGYVAWRGLVEEAELSRSARAAICNHFVFCLPKSEQMLGYPVSGANETVIQGQRRFNFVWYRPAASTQLQDMLTDVHGQTHSLSIPPHNIRPEILKDMRASASALLAPAFAEAVLKTPLPFVQSIVDVKTPTMRPENRIALIGDAAFVARPHVGAGITKAAADADALATALDRHMRLDDALDAFDAIRRPINSAIVDHARNLGAYMQVQLLSDHERALAEAHRKPEAVIRETAVPFAMP